MKSARSRRVICARLRSCCQNRFCWALTETKKVIWSVLINSQHTAPSQRRTLSPRNYFLKFLQPVVVCNFTAVLISAIIRQLSNRTYEWKSSGCFHTSHLWMTIQQWRLNFVCRSFCRKISEWYAATIIFKKEAGIGHSEVSTNRKCSALQAPPLKGLPLKHVPPKVSGESSCREKCSLCNSHLQVDG